MLLHSSHRAKLIGLIVIASQILTPPFVSGQAVGKQTSLVSVIELNRQIQEKKNRIANIRGQIAAFREKIRQKQNERISLENQISIIDDNAASLQLDIEATEQEIEQLSLEIEQANLEIRDKEDKIANGKERLAEVIRSLYQEGEQSALEILLQNDRLSDFFDRLHSLELVESQLQGTLQQVKNLHEQLLAQRASMEHAKTRQEELAKKLEQNSVALDDQKQAKQELITQSVMSAERYQSLLAQARAEQQGIDADITNLERTVREKLKILGDKKAVLAWPVEPIRGISAYFHDPSYPFRNVFEHPAIDIRAGQGTYIKSAEDGYVARVKFDGTKAYAYIMVVHSGGIATVYGHISRALVAQDSYVKKGQVIALSGATPGTVGAGPLTTGPHLHLEVRLNGIPVDPLKYLP